MYTNEVTGQRFSLEKFDAVMYMPIMRKAIVKDEDTIELIDDGRIVTGIRAKPSLVSLLPMLTQLCSARLNEWTFRKCVTEGKIVHAVKGEVDYEKVNVAFVCQEDGERFDLEYY